MQNASRRFPALPSQTALSGVAIVKSAAASPQRTSGSTTPARTAVSIATPYSTAILRWHVTKPTTLRASSCFPQRPCYRSAGYASTQVIRRDAMMKFTKQERSYPVGADLSCTPPIYRPLEHIDGLLADKSALRQSIGRL